MKTPTLLFALLAMFPAASHGQIPKDNPLVAASQKIGSSGLPNGSASEKAGWTFKPTGSRVYVRKYVESMTEDASEREALEQGILAIVGSYEGIAKELKQPNDPATAMAFSVAILYSLAKETDLDDAAFLALSGKLRSTLATVESTDLQKQEFYEWSLCSSGLVVALGAASPDPETKKKLKAMAGAQLLILLGANLDQISLKGGEVQIQASAPPVETTVTGGTAPGFVFQVPEGWRQNSGWYVAETRTGSHVSMAQIRILPAVPASGSFSDALRTAWKTYVPAELKDKVSGMVFRRYVGDGLFAQFVCGRGEEKGKDWDSLFTVILIDCGSYWQPMVVAQTWDDVDTKFSPGRSMSASFSFPSTADLAEVFLKTLSCPSAKGKPLADTSSMVGDFSYGSSATMQWENIYTGATSLTVLSSGGTLNLKSDGSFTDTFVSANGGVGSTKFQSAKGKGKWAVQGDLLVLTYSEYDQGDSYFRKEKKYRISGIVVFSDGERVLVLKNMVNQPVNAVTVQDRSEYYSTKKKD